MTLSRRNVLTGLAVSPVALAAPAAAGVEPEGNLYFLPPEQWFLRVGKDGVITIGAYAHKSKDGRYSYRYVLFHPDDKTTTLTLDGSTYHDGSLFPAHTRYENERFAGMVEEVNDESYMTGRKFVDSHPPSSTA